MSWYDKLKQEQFFVCASAEHNKFYVTSIDETTYKATVRWGRLGTSGQFQVKEFGNMASAANFIDVKINEKRRKGYQPIDKAKFDKLCVEAAIVGTQNKCSNLHWVEIVDAANLITKPCDEIRLQNPDCNPGLEVTVETRKAYGGRHHFNLLFTYDMSIDLSTRQIITKGNPIHELTAKVEEAVGRSLTTA